MPFIETPRGIKWHYELEGEGPCLFFIHGWAVNLRIWRQQCKYFSQNYKVLSIDLPGHGESSWEDVSLADMADDCVFILNQLGLSDSMLVGSSLGGLIALKIYDIRPEKVKSIALVGSHPKFLKTKDYPFGLDVRQMHKIARQLETNYPFMVHVFFRSLFTSEERQTRRFKWIHTFRKADVIPSKNALLKLLHLLEKEDLRDVLNNIAVPVQFIGGTGDYLCQKESFDYWRERLPHARFDIFERCGHFPFLSKPYEVNKKLEEFFNSSVG